MPPAQLATFAAPPVDKAQIRSFVGRRLAGDAGAGAKHPGDTRDVVVRFSLMQERTCGSRRGMRRTEWGQLCTPHPPAAFADFARGSGPLYEPQPLPTGVFIVPYFYWTAKSLTGLQSYSVSA